MGIFLPGLGEGACPTRPNRLRPRRTTIGQYCLLWGWELLCAHHTPASPRQVTKPKVGTITAAGNSTIARVPGCLKPHAVFFWNSALGFPENPRGSRSAAIGAATRAIRCWACGVPQESKTNGHKQANGMQFCFPNKMARKEGDVARNSARNLTVCGATGSGGT